MELSLIALLFGIECCVGKVSSSQLFKAMRPPSAERIVRVVEQLERQPFDKDSHTPGTRCVQEVNALQLVALAVWLH
jgi:hypothetical protein